MKYFLAYAFSALSIVSYMYHIYVGNTVIHLPLFYIVFVLSSFILYHQTHTKKKKVYFYFVYIIVICIAKHISCIPNSLTRSLSICLTLFLSFKYHSLTSMWHYICMFIHQKYTKVSYMAHTKNIRKIQNKNWKQLWNKTKELH